MEKTSLLFSTYHTDLAEVGVNLLLEAQFVFSQNLYQFNAFYIS